MNRLIAAWILVAVFFGGAHIINTGAQDAPKELGKKPMDPPPKQLTLTVMIESASHLTQTVLMGQSSGMYGEVVTAKKVGDNVKKGEKLFQLRFLEGKHAELKAHLHAAKDLAHAAEAAFEWNEHLNKTAAVLANKGASAKEEAEKRKLGALKAKFEWEAAEQHVIAAKERSSPHNPVAEIDGEVISMDRRLIRGFQITDLPITIELMRIADLKELEVTLQIPFKVRHRIQGYEVTPVRDGKKRIGREVRVNKLTDELLEISVVFGNEDGTLRPFEAADVVVRLRD